MQALILAGGEGTRLRPLTYTVAKPVLPLVGRPHIAYVIDWLARHGVDDVIVSGGHLAEGMRNVLEDLEIGVSLRFAEEPDARGTAGAIRFADDMLADRFFVLNGDILCDLDLTAQIEQHERTGARATIALYPVEDPSGYGLIHRRDDGEITEFLEKPEPDQMDTDEINAGAYLLERAVLDEIPPDREVSIEREVFPRLIDNGLYGIRLEGYWIDIGTPDRFLEANWDILEGRVETVDGALDEPKMVGVSCQVAEGAELRTPCVVGDGSRIGDGAVIERSVLLDRCVVEDGAVVTNSILERRRDRGGRSGARGRRDRRGRAGARDAALRARPRATVDDGVIGGDMLDAARAMPDHLRDALWRIESARAASMEAPAAFVCGMGGSAIGGDLAIAALSDRLTKPMVVARGYELPAWAPAGSAVLCSSYSGNTEETLACYAAAEALGAQRLIATTGGELAEAPAPTASR